MKRLMVRMEAAASATIASPAVGGAAQQAVVGEPGIGPLHRPALAERRRLLGLGISLLELLRVLLAFDLVIISSV